MRIYIKGWREDEYVSIYTVCVNIYIYIYIYIYIVQSAGAVEYTD